MKRDQVAALAFERMLATFVVETRVGRLAWRRVHIPHIASSARLASRVVIKPPVWTIRKIIRFALSVLHYTRLIALNYI